MWRVCRLVDGLLVGLSRIGSLGLLQALGVGRWLRDRDGSVVGLKAAPVALQGLLDIPLIWLVAALKCLFFALKNGGSREAKENVLD